MDAALTLIGGPSVLIELAGFRLLTDPTFDAPGRYEARGIVPLTGEVVGFALGLEEEGDAIETAHAFPGARIVAVHNDGWVHFTESQEEFVQAFTTLGLGDRVASLEPGRRTEIALP